MAEDSNVVSKVTNSDQVSDVEQIKENTLQHKDVIYDIP